MTLFFLVIVRIPMRFNLPAYFDFHLCSFHRMEYLHLAVWSGTVHRHVCHCYVLVGGRSSCFRTIVGAIFIPLVHHLVSFHCFRHFPISCFEIHWTQINLAFQAHEVPTPLVLWLSAVSSALDAIGCQVFLISSPPAAPGTEHDSNSSTACCCCFGTNRELFPN